MIVVTTATVNSLRGRLQRWEWQSKRRQWVQQGFSVPVVVGKQGLAWQKQEGDGRTPIGAFDLGPFFGFDARLVSLKFSYRQLTNQTECIDDPRSHFYNQLIERPQVIPDWQSSEKMHQTELYRYGSVIQYNMPATPGQGSCIFMHRWRDNKHGTAGCIALSQSHLLSLLRWLSATKTPRVIVFPRSACGVSLPFVPEPIFSLSCQPSLA